MITINSLDINALIAGFLWPFTRIMGLLAAAPLFGNRSIPARVKVALGLLLSAIVAPTVAALPQMDPMSMTGVLVLAQQFIIGIAMGFAMRIVFTAVELAGELCGMTMGLGFATFFDPQSAGRSSAISQYLSLITLMVYLAANLHLVVLSTLVDSFTTMPVTAMPMGGDLFRQLAGWGGRIFSAGVQLALPVVAGLLITNIALGILTRAAPQLNLFGVGFPVTLTVGFLMLALTLPYLAVPLERLFADGFAMMRQMTAGLPRI
ncbi:flagellar biosynthetic protein FliR [Noviherbaspirillum soli]|uniref:flagellar biosynthetic protein FliR n=1 Tax=Noviherbaspirillum soli TaxID=1064518 RepID=UPI00188A84EF|nr:flagellar biosynthetic protein FliR [Noviherbaspirillum soli]